ncbi:MAG: lipid-A-disaccharide synthase, partial [Salibacteraceae bacterium]
MANRIFIITGEPSGDMHGANLIKELLANQPDLTIQYWGGDRMQKAGGRLMKHIDDLAFMGFVEVIANLPTILKNFKHCRKQIEEFQPDMVVLVDYPGFNLRMAKHIKQLGIPVSYYISPQIWAWKESRVKKIKKYID